MPKEHNGNSFVANHYGVLRLLSLYKGGRIENIRRPTDDEMRLRIKSVSFIGNLFASRDRFGWVVALADKGSAIFVECHIGLRGAFVWH